MAPPTANEPVVFSISDGTEVTKVPILKPALLRRQSLGFGELMDEETTNKLIPLTLDPDLKIDSVAVAEVLDILQREEDLTLEDGDCRLGSLARQCAALWKYRCDPQPFKVLGYHTDPKSSILSNSPSVDQQSGSSPSVSLSGSSRCWRGKKSNKTCGQLLTVAIVLGLKEMLGDEIKVAVWGTQHTVETLVPLKKDIEAIRNDELRKLFDKVCEAINEIGEHNDELAKRIRDAFQNDRPSLGNFHKTWDRNFEDGEVLKGFSPCRFLQAVENDLKGPQESPAQAPQSPSRPQVGPREAPPINLAALLGKFLKKLGLAIDGVDPDKAIIEEMLEQLEKFIEDRKQKLVEELMEWRNGELDGWKSTIKKTSGA